MSTLNQKLNNAIKSFKGIDKITDCDFFIFSRDGIIVFRNLSERVGGIQELGALAGGLCQAAVQLATLYKLEGADDFKLDFSSSEKGLFILPIPVNNHEYFLINFYHEHVNPGAYRIIFRALVNHLVETKEVFETKQIDDFLFNDIKDEEIEYIFKEVRL